MWKERIRVITECYERGELVSAAAEASELARRCRSWLVAHRHQVGGEMLADVTLVIALLDFFVQFCGDGWDRERLRDLADLIDGLTDVSAEKAALSA